MRHILLGILMAAAAWTARAQTFETLRLQRSYAGRADDFTNGYARAVRCEEWGYDNLWNDKTEAMITRASNGQMVMEWESDPVKRIDADGARFLFLISADQSAQPRILPVDRRASVRRPHQPPGAALGADHRCGRRVHLFGLRQQPVG